MNWNEREAIRERLMENLARHMISHGIIKSDRERANPYTCVRMIELVWQGIPFTITQVDGMTCLIERE